MIRVTWELGADLYTSEAYLNTTLCTFIYESCNEISKVAKNGKVNFVIPDNDNTNIEYVDKETDKLVRIHVSKIEIYDNISKVFDIIKNDCIIRNSVESH